jgi:hypothetical protein
MIIQAKIKSYWIKIITGMLIAYLVVVCGCTASRSSHLPATELSSGLSPSPVVSDNSEPIYSPTPIQKSFPIPPNKHGIHLLLDDGRNVWPTDLWPTHLQYARQVVGPQGYVTELIRGDDLDAARWQFFLDLCAEYELIPILRLATTYDQDHGWWRAPQPDADGWYKTVAQTYAQFARELHWPTESHYIVVGNEPNHGNEWSGRPDPAAYARYLIDVAAALHATDPQIRILNAGFDPYTPHTGSYPFIDGLYYMDEESFLDGMYIAYQDVFESIDLWASHAYPLGPFTEPPWQQVYKVDLINDAANPYHIEPPKGIYNRGINGYVWELFKLSTYGVPPLPVMITETGWRHAEKNYSETTDHTPNLPDSKTVACYLSLSFYGEEAQCQDVALSGRWTPWNDDPLVIAVTPFALNGNPQEWAHTNWLEMDTKGEVLGVYNFAHTWIKGNIEP